uniref:Phytocyanin domain-containing protein n=1 Tax=Arundo donax TaxID=35708 RepID=A0A0A8YPI0_ARUDO
MPAMGNPAVMFGVVVVLAAVSTAAAGNATASATKNATAPLPPFGTNHAVGDGKGWFFDWKANASAANYSAWAANRTFYLGDYLSFKTDTGNTVVHTTNATVYEHCRAGDAASGGSGWKPEAAFLAVMLTAEGANYFFSDAWDGEHCRKGMRFEVAVAHGRGLPPVPQSYYEPLSGAPAGMRHGGSVAMWVITVAAFAVVLVL